MKENWKSMWGSGFSVGIVIMFLLLENLLFFSVCCKFLQIRAVELLVDLFSRRITMERSVLNLTS